MTAILEKAVQDEAHDFFAVYVKQEYENIFTNWEIYFNSVVKCAKDAFKNHEAHLARIQRANHEFAMLAFSLLTAPILSWVSGALQYRLGPKLFGDRASTMPSVPRYVAPSPPKPPVVSAPKSPPKAPHPSTVPIDPPRGKTPLATRRIVKSDPTQPPPKDPAPQLQVKPKPLDIKVPDKIQPPVPVVYDPDFSKALGKAFGDFFGSAVPSLGLNPAIKAMVPSSDMLHAQVKITEKSASIEDFEKNMRNTLAAAKTYVGTGIINFAGAIKKDYQYGKKWLARAAHQPSTDPMVAYANDPHEARLRHVVPLIRQAGDEQRKAWARDPKWFYFGNNPPPLHERRTTIAIEAEIWRLWILSEDFKLIARVNPDQDRMPSGVEFSARGNSKIILDTILGRLVAIGVVSSRGLADSGKLNQLWKLDAEVTNIEGAVDTAEELNSIRKWAAERKPELLSGQIAGLPRTIHALDYANVPTR